MRQPQILNLVGERFCYSVRQRSASAGWLVAGCLRSSELLQRKQAQRHLLHLLLVGGTLVTERLILKRCRRKELSLLESVDD
jgi:hypothetical protein